MSYFTRVGVEQIEDKDHVRTAELELDIGRLDRSSFVPLYYQLQEIIKQQIESGRWLPGSPLPGEQELARQFGVSRVVVRQALSILADDHQIRRVRGVGTFVAEPKRESRAGGLYTLLPQVRERDIEVLVLERGTVRVERSICARLRTKHERLVRVGFVVKLSGDTVAIGNSFLPPLSEGLGRACTPGETLPTTLEFPERELSRSEVSIEGAQCDPFEGDLFGLAPRQPVFLVQILEFCKLRGREHPVEFARVVYRSDMLQFRFQVEPAGDSQLLSAMWSLSSS